MVMCAPARGAVCGSVLSEQGKNRVRQLVGLRQHARAGLLEDLILRELDHLRRHVDVADLALRRGQVLLIRREVVGGVLEPVLNRTEGRALLWSTSARW